MLREQRKQAEQIVEPEPMAYGDEDWDAAIEDEGDICMKQVVQEQAIQQKINDSKTEVTIEFNWSHGLP